MFWSAIVAQVSDNLKDVSLVLEYGVAEETKASKNSKKGWVGNAFVML